MNICVLLQFCAQPNTPQLICLKFLEKHIDLINLKSIKIICSRKFSGSLLQLGMPIEILIEILIEIPIMVP